MALGNNLKRIKKDSLIPAKKKKPEKGKLEAVAEPKDKAPIKGKAKANPNLKEKPTAKTKNIAPKAKVIAKPKKETEGSTSAKALSGTQKKSSRKETMIKPVVVNKPKEIANLDEKILIGGEDGASITAKLIPSRRKTVRKTKLIFEGSLSLIEAEAIKDCLLTTFKNYDVIDIQLLNITHLDIIPIQLIKVFIGFYPDKKVKVDSDLPFDMKIIVERAGFGPLMFKEEAA